jgi:hypothetical protein
MIIKDKAHFYELAGKHLCGNTPITWNTLDEYWPYRYDYPYVGIRLMRYGQSKGATSKLPYTDIPKAIVSNGLRIGEYIISAVPIRDTGPGLQGELSWSTILGTWNLYCAFERGYQRRILSEKGQYFHGNNVIWILKHNLLYDDFEDLMDLFDTYSEGMNYPTIEFAVTDRIGWIPSRDMIIWEIRHH